MNPDLKGTEWKHLEVKCLKELYGVWLPLDQNKKIGWDHLIQTQTLHLPEDALHTLYTGGTNVPSS